MDMRNRYRQALQAAAEATGGERELAARLGVGEQDLHAWLEGQAEPPLNAFLDSLNVIADGPYRRRRRRIRVAVLPDPADKR